MDYKVVDGALESACGNCALIGLCHIDIFILISNLPAFICVYWIMSKGTLKLNTEVSSCMKSYLQISSIVYDLGS